MSIPPTQHNDDPCSEADLEEYQADEPLLAVLEFYEQMIILACYCPQCELDQVED